MVYTVRKVAGHKISPNILECDLLSMADLTCKALLHWRDPDILHARQMGNSYPKGRINRSGVMGHKHAATIKRKWIPSDPVVTNGENGEKWKTPWRSFTV